MFFYKIPYNFRSRFQCLYHNALTSVKIIGARIFFTCDLWCVKILLFSLADLLHSLEHTGDTPECIFTCVITYMYICDTAVCIRQTWKLIQTQLQFKYMYTYFILNTWLISHLMSLQMFRSLWMLLSMSLSLVFLVRIPWLPEYRPLLWQSTKPLSREHLTVTPYTKINRVISTRKFVGISTGSVV